MPSIADYRAKYPSLRDLRDEDLISRVAEVDGVSRNEVSTRLNYNPSDLGRGFKESFQQLPQLGYGVIAGVGAAGEAALGEGGIMSGIKKAGVEGYNRWGDKIEAGARPSDSASYSLDQAKEGNFGALVDWAQHGVGYVTGQGLQAFIGAGLGYVGGKFVLGAVAKDLAKGMVMKEAAAIGATAEGKALAQDVLIAQATKNVAGKIGQTVGVGAMAFGQEGGEIFGDLTADAMKEGRQLNGAELAKAFGATVGAGFLEFAGDKLGLDIVMGKSSLLKPAGAMAGLGGRAARGGIAAAAAAPIEAGTEYFQTGLEGYGKGKESNILPFNQSPEAQTGAFDAAALGGLGGAGIGLGGGLMSKARAADAERRLATAPDVGSMVQAATDLAMTPLALPAPATRLRLGYTPPGAGQLALPAPATRLQDYDVLDEAGNVIGPAAHGLRLGYTPPGIDPLALPAPDGQPVYMADAQGNAALQPSAARTEAQNRDVEARQADETAAEFIRRRKLDLGKQTPRGDEPIEKVPVGEVSRFDLIPTGEATDWEYIPTGEATELPKRIPTGRATEIDAEVIHAGDFLTGDNMPYGTQSGAAVRARREGLTPAEVVKVAGGWVVRPQPIGLGTAVDGRPNNTRGTAAADVLGGRREPVADLPRTSGVAAGAADERAPAGLGGGGNLRPLLDGDRGNDSAAQAPAPGRGAAALAGSSSTSDPALTTGSRVDFEGKTWTVIDASPRMIRLDDGQGTRRAISSTSAKWKQVTQAEPSRPAEAGPGSADAAQIAQQGAGAVIPIDPLTRNAGPTNNLSTTDAPPLTSTPGSETPAPAATAVAPAAAARAAGRAVEADGLSPLATAKVGDTVDVVHRDSNGQVEQAGKAEADAFESEKLNLTRIKEISDRQGLTVHTDHMRSTGLAATGWSAHAGDSKPDEFIRKATNSERLSPTAQQRAINSGGMAPAPDGFTINYRPKGDKGAGFYYVATATPNATVPVEAASTSGAAAPEDDYMTQLFGTPAEQEAAQARFTAGESERKQGAEQATGQQRADAKRIRSTITAEKARATAEHDEWAAKVYKKNATQVDLSGDGPSRQSSMSIGTINESRRRNAMEALAQEIRALGKLESGIATDEGAAEFIRAKRDLMAQATRIAADGSGSFKTADEQFQHMLLDEMKVRGPGGKGNVTSNGLSRAILGAIKPDVSTNAGKSNTSSERVQEAPESEQVAPLKDRVDAKRKPAVEPQPADSVPAPEPPAAAVPAVKESLSVAEPKTKRPPKSFRKKHAVSTSVFVEEAGKFEQRETDADTALKALDDDIAEMTAFRKCLTGG